MPTLTIKGLPDPVAWLAEACVIVADAYSVKTQHGIGNSIGAKEIFCGFGSRALVQSGRVRSPPLLRVRSLVRIPAPR